jgi:hypothetical protein
VEKYALVPLELARVRAAPIKPPTRNQLARKSSPTFFISPLFTSSLRLPPCLDRD